MSSAPSKNDDAAKAPAASNFLRQIIERDLAEGRITKVRTRFPPEPNGYLHVGHAKSITVNFGLARDYGGVCHMRFDDTNPEKEEQEYVDGILDAVKWLGWSWELASENHLYYASNYFDFMYRAAEYLIENGHAYVDEQTPEQMRHNRGDFATPGTDSPYRNRTPQQNLARFREMRAGVHADGSMVLRAKIDMGHPNMLMRDPLLLRPAEQIGVPLACDCDQKLRAEHRCSACRPAARAGSWPLRVFGRAGATLCGVWLALPAG